MKGRASALDPPGRTRFSITLMTPCWKRGQAAIHVNGTRCAILFLIPRLCSLCFNFPHREQICFVGPTLIAAINRWTTQKRGRTLDSRFKIKAAAAGSFLPVAPMRIKIRRQSSHGRLDRACVKHQPYGQPTLQNHTPPCEIKKQARFRTV